MNDSNKRFPLKQNSNIKVHFWQITKLKISTLYEVLQEDYKKPLQYIWKYCRVIVKNENLYLAHAETWGYILRKQISK